MAIEGLKFIHKDGRIIPIRPGAGKAVGRAAGKALKVAKPATLAVSAAATAGAIHQARKLKNQHKAKEKPIKVDKKFDAIGAGLSFASGAVAAATFGMGVKGFTGGLVASHVLDAASIGANVKSVAGKGHTKQRVEEGAKREIRNQAIGWGTYGVGILAVPSNRKAGLNYLKKGAGYAQKVLALGRKALKVI